MNSQASAFFGIPEGEFNPIDVRLTGGIGGEEANPSHPICEVAQLHTVTRGKGGCIAIIDTGIDYHHPSFDTRVNVAASCVPGSPMGMDYNGHGTHCACIAAGNGTGRVPLGVAPEAAIVSVQGLAANGGGVSNWLAAAIEMAIRENPDVISLSWGGRERDEMVSKAIDKAYDAGIVVVAAAGNDGPGENTVIYPGALPKVICTGATDNQGKVASFSSRGDALDVGTPGYRIVSAIPGDRLGEMSGTSMATPYAAGLVCLIRCAERKGGRKPMSPQTLMNVLFGYCNDTGPVGHDSVLGWGIPEILRWMEKLATPVQPEPTPDPVLRPFALVIPELVPDGYDFILISRK